MSTLFDIRQSELRNSLNMAGTAANTTVDSILNATDPLIGKLYEDRNILLTGGGLMTFTGTSITFGEGLNLVLNQKISGAVPQIIALGSTTQAFVNSGDMLVATINRTAGTGTLSIITAGNSLPAVAAANQEVFLIAKRVDAADSTQRLYFRNGFSMNAGQTLRLGQGGGSGSGSGTGDDLDALQFRASFTDIFAESATSSVSSINSSGTNATYSPAKNIWTLNYDATKTVTGSGTSMTLSAAPTFTVAIGDLLIQGTEARAITAVASQTSFTIESAFLLVPAPAAAQVTVSQAVYTKDIYNSVIDGAALSASFPGTTFSEILVDYKDNAVSGSNLWAPDVTPLVAFTATNDNTTFTTKQVRATNTTDLIGSTFLPSAGSALYLRFFSNATSGSGFANLITYKAFMQKATALSAGGIMNSAYGFTNSVGTPVNASFALVGGKTTVTLAWNYAVGAFAGTSEASIEVYLNGSKIPRFLDSITTPDASFTETSVNVITLDRNYSQSNLSLSVIQRTNGQPVDTSTANVTAISQNQEIQNQGFQGFINTQNLLTATSNTGTPAQGTFQSLIQNRASIVDMTQDLKPRMGIERLMTQSIVALQTEFGAAGEPVNSVLNDTSNYMRFVGYGWTASDAVYGPYVFSTNVGDYAEITFYGTGLNMLTVYSGTTNATLALYVDGILTSSNVNLATTGSAILGQRNYAANQVLPIVSGLALGVHTVRIQSTAITQAFSVYGFEVLNVSSNVITNPGSAYVGGKKLTTTAVSTIPYNTAVVGARGGRILQYMAANGTIGQAFTQVATTASFLTAATHANEEIARTYSPREFGAGRTDDFSRIASTNQAAAFTLDDGTTTLILNTGSAATVNGVEGFSPVSAAGNFLTLTFVGTGLDVTFSTSALSATIQATVDGGTAQTIAIPATGISTQKIVSGLPYGTHNVKIAFSTYSSGTFSVVKFITYQPVMPTLPAGAVALADYFVMANYVANTVQSTEAIATGVIKKVAAREFTYTGTWTVNTVVGTGTTGESTGLQVSSTTTGAAMTYTFFGTGFEWRFQTSALVGNYTLLIDGLTPTAAGGTTSFYGNVTSFTGSTGAIVTGNSNNYGNGVIVSGLTLGFHTMKITFNSGSSMNNGSLDIITPIYSPKSNTFADIQNTLAIGSQGISDDRKTSIIKDSLPATKAWAQAVGVVSNPTTTSTSPVPCPDMSVVVKTGADGKASSLRMTFAGTASTSSNAPQFVFFVDGVQTGPFMVSGSTSTETATPNIARVPVSSGNHKVDVYWYSNGGTLTLGNRILLVEEV